MVYGVDANYTFNNAGVFVVTLTVKDAAGNTHTDTVEITVNDTGNPVANAGANQSVKQGDLVTFNGSLSTDNVAVTNFTWTFNDGGAKTLYGAGPNYTFNNPGVFVVTLTAKDSGGNTQVDTLTVTVNETTAPVANAGPNQMANQGDLVTFNGSGSTDNVGVVNYTWTFNDGGAKTFYEAGPNYTFLNAGAFVVTLNVTDLVGNWHTDTMTVTVNDTEKPVANAGANQTVNQRDTVTFDGSASTDNVALYNYTWTFTYDSILVYRFGPNPSSPFQIAGQYIVTLNVTDTSGNWAVDTMTVTVNDTTNPVADAGADKTVYQGDNVTFNGSGSSDNVGVVNYMWTFDDGGLQTLYGAGPKYTFNTSGVFTVTLNVTDANGYWAIDTVLITVTDNTDPVANAGLDQTVDQLITVFFNGSGSTDNIAINNYTWTFQYSSITVHIFGEKASWTFEHAGVYTVTLTVLDNEGNAATDTMNVTVADITEPTIDAGGNQTVKIGTKVFFDGTDSTDNVGIVNYTWTVNDSGPQTLYGSLPNYTFDTAGIFEVIVEVRDQAGNLATDTFFITVTDYLPPVIAPVSDQKITQLEELRIPLTAVSSEGGTVSFALINPPTGMSINLLTGVIVWIPSVDQVGLFNITVKATDIRGIATEMSFTVTVIALNQVPVPAFNHTVDSDSAMAPKTIIFNATPSSDADGNIITYIWDFGDGFAGVGKIVTHTYVSGGNYTVNLTVIDNVGGSASVNKIITVEEGGQVGSISGRITFSDGNPGNVKAMISVSMGGMITQTASGNSFVLANLPYGNYVISVIAEGYHGENASYVVNGVETLDFHLNKLVMVRDNESEKIVHTDPTGKVVVDVVIMGNGTPYFNEMDENETQQRTGDSPTGFKDLGVFVEITFTGDLIWIRIEVPYDESALPADVEESSLKLYYWNTATNAWEVIEGSTVDTDANIVWANVTHLTIFAPMGAVREVSGESTEESSNTYMIVIFAVVLGLLVVILLLFASRKKETPTEDLVDLKEDEEDVDEYVEEEDLDEDGDFECPDCGEMLGELDSVCGKCGAEFEGEEEEDDEEEKGDDGEEKGDDDEEEEGEWGDDEDEEGDWGDEEDEEEEGDDDEDDEGEGDWGDDEEDEGADEGEKEDDDEETDDGSDGTDDEEGEGDWGDDDDEEAEGNWGDDEADEESDEGEKDDVEEETDDGGEESDEDEEGEGDWGEEDGTDDEVEEDEVDEEEGEADADVEEDEKEEKEEGDWDDDDGDEGDDEGEGVWDEVNLEIFED
ncbi:MAG: PKD domain-containing protein [Candidatus Thermoplasmatota archaeon]|nr:PKD domain-containing protein [Candidatus Thermoplasmatota archaeon]